ncbi:MAG: BadF/BadG/BcrA/BcrD ATPase family protein [Eubacteriales bacterium]
MPKYYISADGGGTKLFSVLFDDQFNLISQSKSGAVNPSFTDLSEIENNMRDSIENCLAGTGITQIDHLYITMPGPSKLYEHILKKSCTLNGFTNFTEGYACLISGLFERRGIVALSGTGSGVFYVDGNKNISSIGGWGALFGDEGSGYEIGAAGIRAAQHAVDGRGKDTLLVEMIKAQFSFKNLHDIVSYTYSKNSYRNIISSVCLTVCKAAQMGDIASIDIMKAAGRAQGLMLNTIIRKNITPFDLSVVVSGSVWRYNPYMYDSFCDYVHAEYPCYKINKPQFEPVISGIIQKAFDLYGEIDNNISSKLRKEFAGYIYEK